MIAKIWITAIALWLALTAIGAHAASVDIFRADQICKEVRRYPVPQMPSEIRKNPELFALMVQCGILAATKEGKR